MTEMKRLAEDDRPKSSILLDRKREPPKSQDRPASPPKFEANENDFEKLVEFTLETIENVAKKYNTKAEGKAKIIKTEDIVMDLRVRWKCIIPTCFGYGSSAHCPPHSPTYEQMKEIVSSYKYAIFIRYSPLVTRNLVPQYGTEGIQIANETNEIVGIVEAEAGYMGYYLAMGFKGGPCGLCGMFSPQYNADFALGKEIPKCSVLEGKMCSQFLKARPALEASSVDVFATARKIGWESPYIIMPEHPEKSVPNANWFGMVLLT
jgi:predicted metal-binding protein